MTLEEVEEAQRFHWNGTEYIVTTVDPARGFFEFVEFSEQQEPTPSSDHLVERRLSASELEVVSNVDSR